MSATGTCRACDHADHRGARCHAGGDADCPCFEPTIRYGGWPGFEAIETPKQPFRCPVCIGSGRVPLLVSSDVAGVECRPCSGTGIVWGPP